MSPTFDLRPPHRAERSLALSLALTLLPFAVILSACSESSSTATDQMISALGGADGRRTSAPLDGGGASDDADPSPSGAGADRGATGAGGSAGAGGSPVTGGSAGGSPEEPDLGAMEPDQRTGAPPMPDQALPPAGSLGPCGTPLGSGRLTPSEEEAALGQLLNAYREERGLPPLPISEELTYVARRHSEDLSLNYPFPDANCNLHSWSDDGDEWSPCCYTPDHAESACMWRKPGEMTSFRGNGYEISAAGYRDVASALRGWQGSPGHNSVILNEGIWAAHPFEAMGIGICGGFYNVWFGP